MSERERQSVVVVASTFPASPTDPVPAFVRDQVVALAEEYPHLDFHVLAPHDARSATVDRSEHEGYVEHRFHYARPRTAEKLAGRGIMPAIRENKLLYAVIPMLFAGEHRALVRLVREVRPAVIYAHWFTPQAIVAARVGARFDIPVVFTTHASDVEVWHRVPVLGPRIVRGVSRRVAAATAVSTRSRAKLLRFLGDDSTLPLAVIPMGVHMAGREADPVARERARGELGVAADERCVLLIGRLVEKKGTEFLLRALASADADFGPWRLVIAGDGPLREPLEALAAELGIADRVHFTGYVTGESKDAAFRAADIFAVPSVIAEDGDAEGLPVALLEGLSYGLPSIATPASGADDVLTDGVDGFLCADRDPADLLRALTAAAALSPDDRARLSEAARQTGARFDWPVVARAHYDFLFAPVLDREATR